MIKPVVRLEMNALSYLNVVDAFDAERALQIFFGGRSLVLFAGPRQQDAEGCRYDDSPIHISSFL